MARFPGVYAAIVTPFTESYEVDYKRLHEHVDWLIQEGVHGIIPTGSLGEYAVLSNEERARVIEVTIEAAKGRAPVVVGAAAPATRTVVELVQFSKEKGAAGIMALPPINYKSSLREVIAHYEAIASVGLPIIVYNNPRDYPVDLTVDVLKELSKIENVVAVKEFSGDIRRVHDIIRETDLEVLIGVDDLGMEGPVAGATGWIAGFVNAFPKESVELFELARQGNVTEAMKIYRYFMPLLHLDADPLLVQYIKYTMELVGKPAGPTRPPRLPLTEEGKEKVRKALDYFLNRPRS